jgi:alkanesulfonate monooxygenase SsuD/methylene tetrahydromethanopterin reductase-like flavin-dependent oxidoreductase (luciferase family)
MRGYEQRNSIQRVCDELCWSHGAWAVASPSRSLRSVYRPELLDRAGSIAGAREIAEFVGLGGRGPVVVGSPTQVADRLQRWMEETDVDGFNLAYAVMPETYEDIINLLIPELQRRGVYKQEYRTGSLREKLFGQGPFLPETHPGRNK